MSPQPEDRMPTVDEVLREVEKTGAYPLPMNTIEDRSITGSTPLETIVYWQDLTALEVLLKAGANVHAILEDGATVLHEAAALEDPALVEMLLAYGADPTARDRSGDTPLDMAEIFQNGAIMEILKRAEAEFSLSTAGSAEQDPEQIGERS